MSATLKNILIVVAFAVASLSAAIVFSPAEARCDQACQEGLAPATPA